MIFKNNENITQFALGFAFEVA